MIVTPTSHVFEMYKIYHDATQLSVKVAAPEYKPGDNSVPSVDASTSRDEQDVHPSLVNLDPQRESEITVKLVGVTARSATGRVLTASAMGAHSALLSRMS
jgi:alpha-N-arabinofuranosidase